jgi:hypothetical protein
MVNECGISIGLSRRKRLLQGIEHEVRGHGTVTLPQFHRHLRFRDNFPIGGLYESQAKVQG